MRCGGTPCRRAAKLPVDETDAGPAIFRSLFDMLENRLEGSTMPSRTHGRDSTTTCCNIVARYYCNLLRVLLVRSKTRRRDMEVSRPLIGPRPDARAGRRFVM